MVTIVDVLGGERVLGKRVRTDLDFNRLVQRGLPLEAVQAMARRAGLSERELERIVSRKTRLRLRTAKLLTPELSDKVARYARVLAMAEETFADAEKANTWLRRANRALEGATPFEMLATDNGARIVEGVLGRLAYGVFS
jgi:putative toxin-antitoxin system antitoxin component (TIGR02293 family)